MSSKHINVTWGLWGILSAWCSFVVNKSIGWALLHFFCGFFYLLYAAFVYTDELSTYFNKLFGL